VTGRLMTITRTQTVDIGDGPFVTQVANLTDKTVRNSLWIVKIPASFIHPCGSEQSPSEK